MDIGLELGLKLLPLYLIVMVGFMLGRFMEMKALDIGKVALFVLSPAVVFKGFSTASLDLTMLLLPFGGFLLASLVSFASLPLASRIWSDGRERVASFSAGTGNTGFFGIPACLALVGEDALPIVVLVAFGATLYENTSGYFIMARAEATIRGALWQMFKYPGVHALWAGLLVNAFGIPLPQFIPEAVNYLAQGYVAAGMLIIGLSLANMRGFRVDLGFLAYVFSYKFILWPAMGFGIIWADKTWFQALNPMIHDVILIECLVPVAAVTVVHATLRNIHPDRAAMAVALSTAFALVWLPLIYGLRP